MISSPCGRLGAAGDGRRKTLEPLIEARLTLVSAVLCRPGWRKRIACRGTSTHCRGPALEASQPASRASLEG